MAAYIKSISASETGDKIYIPDDIYDVFFAPRLTQQQKDFFENRFVVDIPATDSSASRDYTFRLRQVLFVSNWKICLSGDWRNFARNQNIDFDDLVEFKWADPPDFRLFCRVFHQGLVPEGDASLHSANDFDDTAKTKATKIISDLLKAVSIFERRESKMKIREDSDRLGKVGVSSEGGFLVEKWEDGQAFKDLNDRLGKLLEAKERVERQQKLLREQHKSDEGDTESGNQEEDFLRQDEIYKFRLDSIKKEEEEVLQERDRYEAEKGRLIREMKRVRDEDDSRFNNYQILNRRYALLNLLGKGGFSEVYKAYDLEDYRYVACKLHALNPQWSEEKTRRYLRHARRECDIQKTLVHDNIVRLWDTFEIDHNTFCTVLEFCSGKDLDAVLKATPVLSEKEAKIIILQIFQGLVHLNKRTQKVIHYDLKPGNVLFDELGVAKLTDFGLSKLVEEDVGPQGMELTSQGAGTYWYLPPECFELTKIPLISSKVDVWSAGVLFYQMLFGRRPFGHDQSQEQILHEGTILNAREVDFPANPSVSTEAKELIRRCLTYNQAERADVFSIAKDPYFHIPRNER